MACECYGIGVCRQCKAEEALLAIPGLHARLQQAEARTKWQPIESAPRDGTEVLLYDRGTMDHGSWGFIEMSDWDQKPVYGWTSNRGYIEDPTHWMPSLGEPGGLES